MKRIPYYSNIEGVNSFEVGKYYCTSIKRIFQHRQATLFHGSHQLQEIWSCSKGAGRLYINNEVHFMVKGSSVVVPPNCHHIYISDDVSHIEILHFRKSPWEPELRTNCKESIGLLSQASEKDLIEIIKLCFQNIPKDIESKENIREIARRIKESDLFLGTVVAYLHWCLEVQKPIILPLLKAVYSKFPTNINRTLLDYSLHVFINSLKTLPIDQIFDLKREMDNSNIFWVATSMFSQPTSSEFCALLNYISKHIGARFQDSISSSVLIQLLLEKTPSNISPEEASLFTDTFSNITAEYQELIRKNNLEQSVWLYSFFENTFLCEDNSNVAYEAIRQRFNDFSLISTESLNQNCAIKLVHLSDIHGFTPDTIIRELIIDISRFADVDKPIYILMTGDTANKGDIQEFDEIQFKLKSALKCSIPKCEIMMVLGNHDLSSVNGKLHKPETYLDNNGYWFNVHGSNETFCSFLGITPQNSPEILNRSKAYGKIELTDEARSFLQKEYLERTSKIDRNFIVSHYPVTWFNFIDQLLLLDISNRTSTTFFSGHEHNSHFLTSKTPIGESKWICAEGFGTTGCPSYSWCISTTNEIFVYPRKAKMLGLRYHFTFQKYRPIILK